MKRCARWINNCWGCLERTTRQPHPAEVQAEDVQRFWGWLEQEEYAPSTIRTCLTTVTSFYRYALKQGLLPGDPAAEIRPETVSRPKAKTYTNGRYLTEAETQALLGAIDVETLWGKRDYALILFLLRTGRKTAEALGMRWGDFEVGKEGRCIERLQVASWRVAG